MPTQANIYSILVASPSDLPEEREAVRIVMSEWNEEHAAREGIVIIPLMWERDVPPVQGARPQEIVNRHAVDRSDALIALFGVRLGTHTGVSVSGTVEEIELCLSRGKPVLVYFSRRPRDPYSVDSVQFEQLRSVRDRFQQTGIVGEFDSVDDLKARIRRDLPKVLPRHPDGVIDSGVNASGNVLVDYEAKTKDHRVFVIRNVGAEDAKDISLAFEGQPKEAEDIIVLDEPLPLLRSGEKVEFSHVRSAVDPQRVDVTVAWTDVRGGRHERKKLVTLQ